MYFSFWLLCRCENILGRFLYLIQKLLQIKTETCRSLSLCVSHSVFTNNNMCIAKAWIQIRK